MKTLLTAAILGLTAFAGAVGAEADDGSRRGPGPAPSHGHPAESHRGTRRCLPAPRFERIDVERDSCGRPVYRLVRLPERHRHCD